MPVKTVEAQTKEFASWIKQKMLERGRDRLIEFLASTDDDGLEEATRAKLHKIADERVVLLRQIETVQNRAAEQAVPADTVAAITALVVELKKETTDNFAEKRRRLEELGCRVYCAGGQYTVSITSEAIPL